MYSFDIAQNQYHKMSKYTDKSDYINDHYDRSMRANIDTLQAENTTSYDNYQTSFYVEALDVIMYSQI